MAEMARSREMTQHALDCRAHDIATCPNFAASVSDIIAETAPPVLGPNASAGQGR